MSVDELKAKLRAALYHAKELHERYWTPDNIFWSVFVFGLIIYLWELYLKYRQYRLVVRTEFAPNEVAPLIDQKTYVKARKYRIDRSRFSFVRSIVGECFSSVLFLWKFEALSWFWLGDFMERQGYDSSNEYLHSGVYFCVLALIGTIISLPWQIYETFVIEERHGFNKQTFRFFLWDTVKKFFVQELITLPIGAGIIYIVKLGGDLLFLYMWLFCLVLLFLLMTVYPEYIAPLFDTFTPLPEGTLRVKIEELAQSINFPLKKIFVVDGSKRSAHSNAYMYGLFNNKRIVLFDTLFRKESPSPEHAELDTPAEPEKPERKGCSDNEILAILCHELGHWKYSHVKIALVISQIHLFISFFIFGMLYKDPTIYKAFGFETQFPTMFGLLIIMQHIYAPFNTFLNYLMTALTRKHEYEADDFAKKMHRASYLREALITLNKDNLDLPVDDPWYSAWFRTHPTLLERITRLGKLD